MLRGREWLLDTTDAAWEALTEDWNHLPTDSPLRENTVRNTCLATVIRHDAARFGVTGADLPDQPWLVLVHQVRITAEAKAFAAPAPEGIHRDGHKFLALHLIARINIGGGESAVYDGSGRMLHQCVLEDPLDTLYLHDECVMHGVTPISSFDGQHAAVRDMLIIDFDDPSRHSYALE
jgi:hypothetical protein